MERAEGTLTIQELSDKAGVPIRTIRFYISQRLLRGPDGRGTATSYTEDHLLRLSLIRRLAERHLPLNEIQERLERVSPGELSLLLGEEESRGESEERARAGSPRDYLSTLLETARQDRGRSLPEEKEAWRHVKIAAGIELHYTLEMERRNPSAVRDIIDQARKAIYKTKGKADEKRRS